MDAEKSITAHFSLTMQPLVHYTFDTGDEGWGFAGAIAGYDTPFALCQNGVLGITAQGSTNAFSYWYSPDVTIEDGNIYRARWTVGSTCATADTSVDFRLRINQKGSWQAWDRIVNSNLGQAPCSAENKVYDLFFDPDVAGIADASVVLNFDIMSFDVTNDAYSWLFLDELSVIETGIASTSDILEYTFDSGGEGWQYAGSIPPFDQPIISVPAGKIGLSPNGSTNCFSYLYSPDATIQDGKIYGVMFEMSSSVTNADNAVQFRLRVNQKGSWQAWDRIVNSNMGQAPSNTGTKSYNVILDPDVTGSGDNLAVFSFDIMSFDAGDDPSSWLFLESVALDEITLSP